MVAQAVHRLTGTHSSAQLPACFPLLLDFPSRRCLKRTEVYLLFCTEADQCFSLSHFLWLDRASIPSFCLRCHSRDADPVLLSRALAQPSWVPCGAQAPQGGAVLPGQGRAGLVAVWDCNADSVCTAEPIQQTPRAVSDWARPRLQFLERV